VSNAEYCTKYLRCILLCQLHFVFFYCFHVAGVLEQFQKGHLRRKDYKVDDATDIEIQCDLLVIVSIICQFDIHRKV